MGSPEPVAAPSVLGMYFISSALIAGVAVKAVLDRVAATGILDAFALGRAVRKGEK